MAVLFCYLSKSVLSGFTKIHSRPKTGRPVNHGRVFLLPLFTNMLMACEVSTPSNNVDGFYVVGNLSNCIIGDRDGFRTTLSIYIYSIYGNTEYL